MHCGFYECFSTVIEIINPYFDDTICKDSINVFLFLTGIFLLRLTGGLSEYCDFMDDEDDEVYYKKKNMRTMISKTLRKVNEISKASSASAPASATTPMTISVLQSMSWKGTVRRQKIRTMRREAKARRWFGRKPLFTCLIDLLAFYCMYISVNNFVGSNTVSYTIEQSKLDILNALPSSQIVRSTISSDESSKDYSGYHPSLISRFLRTSLDLVPEDSSRFELNEEYMEMIRDNVEQIYADADDDDEDINRAEKEDGIENYVDLDHDSCTVNLEDKNDDDQCTAVLYENRESESITQSCHSTCDKSILESYMSGLLELEEQLTAEDDEYILGITSQGSYAEYFGNYEAKFVSSGPYFTLYSLVFLLSLFLFTKVGVSPENVLG
jgi:hypothetical protein